MTIWLSRLQTIRLKLRFFGGKNLLEILYAMKLQKGEKQNKKKKQKKAHWLTSHKKKRIQQNSFSLYHPLCLCHAHAHTSISNSQDGSRAIIICCVSLVL